MSRRRSGVATRAQHEIIEGRGLWRREAAVAWPLVQATAAATVAWLIATHLARHHQPFFAPIAAVVALNTTTGERGTHALRLLIGVFVGIVVGEVTIVVLESAYISLALATFTAMIIARHIGGARLTTTQAAASAILTVAVARGEAGTQRLGDALIGAGIALAFSQILFTPEPVGLIHRASVATLRTMTRLLTLTTQSLEQDVDGHQLESMVDGTRELHGRLGELGQMTRAANRVVRHSVYWRSHWEGVARESTAARHLELAGGDVLMLVRIARATAPSARRELAPVVRDLSEIIGTLARAPQDHRNRQRAVERAREIAGRNLDAGTSESSILTDASLTARMLVTDLIAFLDVDRH